MDLGKTGLIFQQYYIIYWVRNMRLKVGVNCSYIIERKKALDFFFELYLPRLLCVKIHEKSPGLEMIYRQF